jgi:hypothetical protein
MNIPFANRVDRAIMSSKVLHHQHCPCFQPRFASLGLQGQFWSSLSLRGGVVDHSRFACRCSCLCQSTPVTCSLKLYLKTCVSLLLFLCLCESSHNWNRLVCDLEKMTEFYSLQHVQARQANDFFGMGGVARVTHRVQRSFAVQILESLESQSALESVEGECISPLQKSSILMYVGPCFRPVSLHSWHGRDRLSISIA